MMDEPFLREHLVPTDFPGLSQLGRKWGWLLATGIVYIVLGIAAFSLPIASTVGLTFGLAILLLVGGIIHLIHAVELRHESGGAPRFFHSIVSIVAGFLMFRYPGGGMLGVAIALSFYFFVGAASQWILASAMRPHKGWGWGILGAAASFVLGVYIIVTFPFSALWVPGTLLGINLVFVGVSMIGFSFTARKAHRDSLTHAPEERPLGRVA